MKKILTSLALVAGIAFSSSGFAAYYLHVYNHTGAYPWPDLHTLKTAQSNQKIEAPAVYPANDTGKIQVTIYSTSSTGISSSGEASITIGTEDWQHYCQFYVKRETTSVGKDTFSPKIASAKGANCTFNKIDNNTGKLDIN